MPRYVDRLGADEVQGSPVLMDALARIEKQGAEIAQRQRDDAKTRKWQFAVAVGGMLFAAVRLGLIAIPKYRGV